MRKSTLGIVIAFCMICAFSATLQTWNLYAFGLGDLLKVVTNQDEESSDSKAQESAPANSEVPPPPALIPPASPADSKSQLPPVPTMAPSQLPQVPTLPTPNSDGSLINPQENPPAAQQAPKGSSDEDLQEALAKARQSMDATVSVTEKSLPPPPKMSQGDTVEQKPAELPAPVAELPPEEEIVEEEEEPVEEIERAIDITMPLPREKKQNKVHQLALFRCYCQYADSDAQKKLDAALWTLDYVDVTVKDEETGEVSEVFSTREKAALLAQQKLSNRLEKNLKK